MNRPRIPLLVPDLPGRAELEPFFAAIDDARWYTNFGPLLCRFEKDMQALFEGPAPALTTMANGTMALELALAALGLPKGANVLIPAFTFVATASAVVRAGLRPMISDIDPNTWIMTPAIARDAMKMHRIDCVMPVAALGCPVPSAQWDEFSMSTEIPVLVDAAGAFGNQKAGDRIALAFSLHATKAFGAGEGGLVVSRDTALIERVRQLSNFGIDASTGFATYVGSNAKMSELHAAMGMASLARWPQGSSRRRELHRRYCEALTRACPGITFQERSMDGVYTILQILLPQNADRDAVAAAMNAGGIETRAWYLPLVPDHPAYVGIEACELPVARALAPRMLGIPFHPGLSDDDIAWVCGALGEAIR